MAERTKIPTALITGASSGMGALFAERLAARGNDLILVARDEAGLQATAERIMERHAQSIRVLTADLTQPDDLAEVEAVLHDDPNVEMLVNSAGIGAVTPLLASDPDQMQRMIALNVTALTRLVRAAVPCFVARKRGTIVNIASSVALAPETLNGVYGATKAFVLTLGRALEHELADTGVRVQTVLPGATATPFWASSGTSAQALDPAIVMSPEDVVDAALAGLDAGESVTIPSLPDMAAWDAFEAARRAMMPNLSRATPAARYGLHRSAG